MEKEKKKLLFCSYFRHISLFFYSNSDQERSLDAELNYASNEYPLDILLMGLATPKNNKYLKKRDDDSTSNKYPLGILLTGPATPKTRNT